MNDNIFITNNYNNMKKYLSLFFAAMVAVVCSSAFVSCGGDDDEDGGGSTPSSSTTLKINGVDWVASTANPPLFYGHFDGSNSYGLIFTKFTRKETSDMQELFPDNLKFDVTMKMGKSITKGLNLVSSEDVMIYGGNSDFLLSEGILGESNFRYGVFDLQGATGSAVIVDFKENDFLTVKFTNFKVTHKSDGTTQANKYNAITIDGTVTYKYTAELTDVIV